MPVTLQSLSKGISKFTITIYPWLENERGEKRDLREKVINPFYRGVKPYVLVTNEIIKSRSVLDFREVIPTLYPPPLEQSNKSSLITLLKDNDLHIEILVEYPGYEIYEKGKYYDYFYLDNFYFELVKEGENVKEVLFTGDWVFGGRNEKYLHP